MFFLAGSAAIYFVDCSAGDLERAISYSVSGPPLLVAHLRSERFVAPPREPRAVSDLPPCG
jgi:hypothetical protein